MKLLKLLGLVSLLMASSLCADGIGFGIGPFSLQLGGGPSYYTESYVYSNNGSSQNANEAQIENPFCYAIMHQNRLQIVVETAEKVNEKEKKITVKKLVVEPYAFGITREGKTVLNGIVISDKLVKEVTIKSGDEKGDDEDTLYAEKKKGRFSGWFKSDKSQNIDIQEIRDIKVLEDSHFVAPKKYKGMNEKDVKVICELPITSD